MTEPTNEELLAEIKALRSRIDHLETSTKRTGLDPDAVEKAAVSRRALFGMAGAGVAGAAVLGSASPAAADVLTTAAANDGDALMAGATNIFQSETTFQVDALTTANQDLLTLRNNGTTNTGAVLEVDQNSTTTGKGIEIQQAGGGIALDIDVQTSGRGINVEQSNGVAAVVIQQTGTGNSVLATGFAGQTSSNINSTTAGSAPAISANATGSGAGLAAVSTTGSSITATASGTGSGVVVSTTSGTGVDATSSSGTGVAATGDVAVDANGTTTGVDASGTTAVIAAGTTTGVTATGPTAVSAAGTTTGVTATGPTAVSAAGTTTGVTATGPTAVSATGTTSNGVKAATPASGAAAVLATNSTASAALAGAANAVRGVISAAGNGSHAVLGVTAGGGHAVAGTSGAATATTWGRNSGAGAGIGGENTGSGVGGIFRGGTNRGAIVLEVAGTGLGAAAGSPTSGAHVVGEMYVDSDGDLYFCTAAGSPGTFTKLNDQAPTGGGGSATELTLLSKPVRAFDSRAGRNPDSNAPGDKGQFSAGETRIIDLNASIPQPTGIPGGATAALINLTVILSGSANGFASVYSNSVATSTPTFSSINWSSQGQIIANEVTTAIDAAAKIKVYTSGPTDIAVDVVGYYS